MIVINIKTKREKEEQRTEKLTLKTLSGTISLLVLASILTT